ncbi:glycosyltransferase family 1 protein [Brumimicrobium glaciale]|uniref:Glycosyltransferase family 1 protein n=1 Tax=Brumimicrobium glaciale TaxID=200475 RepID=A0A4Q4KRY5_9FLAO|nr:glycosyltransferase [Brumimicrobium glaciale]RYM35692.1 glycosyltransferase family 1 protein [Brumimicrobium glaciale]
MDRKIKVVRIINRFNIGGPTFNATFLTKFLGDEFETTLIGGVPDEGEKDSHHILEQYGITPIIIPEIQRSLNPVKDYKAYKKIRELLKEIKPDIVHTHASKAGFVGRAAAISLKIPVILHTFHGHVFHSYFGNAKTQLFKQIERFLAKRSTGIIAISDIQKQELSEIHKIAPANKIKVIPLGFDLEKFSENKAEKRAAIRKEYNIQENEVAIAIVGRLAPVKDHDYFLKVIEELLGQTKTKIKVFIVGDGSEKAHIEERVAEIHQKYPNTIVMTSWILDIATFNQGMDIMCLTSKNEGTPVSIIEAQASGIAVISTDVGGVRDILEEGKAGFVIKRENSETYTDKLRLLVEDSSLREKFSIFGQENVKYKFSYHRLVDDTRKYYKSLL